MFSPITNVSESRPFSGPTSTDTDRTSGGVRIDSGFFPVEAPSLELNTEELSFAGIFDGDVQLDQEDWSTEGSEYSVAAEAKLSIPKLAWPTLESTGYGFRFGSNWKVRTSKPPNECQMKEASSSHEPGISPAPTPLPYAVGCDCNYKRHTGIDIVIARKGRDGVLRASSRDDSEKRFPVFAAHDGTIRLVHYDKFWKHAIVLQHEGFTTVYWHVDPLLSSAEQVKINTGKLVRKVRRGEKIAGFADLGTLSHLHFGIRVGDYSSLSVRGALPRINCGVAHSEFPSGFVDPLKYVSRPGENRPKTGQ